MPADLAQARVVQDPDPTDPTLEETVTLEAAQGADGGLHGGSGRLGEGPARDARFTVVGLLRARTGIEAHVTA